MHYIHFDIPNAVDTCQQHALNGPLGKNQWHVVILQVQPEHMKCLTSGKTINMTSMKGMEEATLFPSGLLSIT